MKKVLSVVLALATAASMAVSSFAADKTYSNYSLKATDFKQTVGTITDMPAFTADDVIAAGATTDNGANDVTTDIELTAELNTAGDAVVVSYLKTTLEKDVKITIDVTPDGTTNTYTATKTLSATKKPGNSGTIVTKPAAGEFGNAYGSDDNQLLPGNKYGYYIPSETEERMDDRSIVTASWSVGGAMVEGYKIKETGGTYYFELELKENYTLVDLKDLKGTITFKKLDADHKGTSVGYAFEDAMVANDFDGTWKGYSNRDDAEDDMHTVYNNTVYEIDGSGWVCFGDEGRLIQVLAKFSDNQKIFAYFNENKIDAVLDKYDDGEADIDFIRFVAKPSLKKTSTITFDRGFSDKGYIYEWANGKLNNIKGAKWDAEDGTWTIETNKLGDYVFSDEKLISETSEASSEVESSSDTGSTTEPNPGTGASDFVGLAVALAVVSVAGIAVAKRK